MKNLSILSILLLVSASAVAMEGRWKQEEPEETEQQSKAPSLKNLCFEAMKNVTDSEPIKDFYHPDLSAGIWDNIPQYLVDYGNKYYVNKLLAEEYPADVKAAMIKRLTLDSQIAEELFKQALDPENHHEDKPLIACALFVKNKDLQTWKNGQKLAESGPITLEAAKIIIHATGDCECFQPIGENYFPETMLFYHNYSTFKQAALELIHKEEFAKYYTIPITNEKSTLRELCNSILYPHPRTRITPNPDIKDGIIIRRPDGSEDFGFLL